MQASYLIFNTVLFAHISQKENTSTFVTTAAHVQLKKQKTKLTGIQLNKKTVCIERERSHPF